MLERKCGICGLAILPEHGRQKYCSLECHKKARVEHDKRYYEKRKAMLKTTPPTAKSPLSPKMKTPIYTPATSEQTKKMQDFDKIICRAMEMGLSYGKYVQKYGDNV